jgi:hypothetical protein
VDTMAPTSRPARHGGFVTGDEAIEQRAARNHQFAGGMQPAPPRVPPPPEPPPPPPVPRQPAPRPQPTGPRLSDYRHDPESPPAYKATVASTKKLAEIRGEPARLETLRAVQALDKVIAGEIDSLRSGETGSLALCRDALARRSVYAERASALAGFLGVEAGVPTLDVPDLVELERRALALRASPDRLADAVKEARDLVAAADGEVELAIGALDDPDPGRFRFRSGSGSSSARAEWDRRLREIGMGIRKDLERLSGKASHHGAVVQPHTIDIEFQALRFAVGNLGVDGPSPYDEPARAPLAWYPDVQLMALDAALQAQARAPKALAAALAREEAAAAVIGAAVKLAVAAAGGAASVADGARSAVLLSDPPPRHLRADFAAVASAMEEHRRREAELEQLTRLGVQGGRAFDCLTASIDEAMTRIVEARQSLAGKTTGPMLELVALALAGRETARQELERLATQYTRCFPGGLAAALAACRYDRVIRAH